MKKSLLAAASVGLFAGSALAAPAMAVETENGQPKTLLCHVTESDSNPIVLIEVAGLAGPLGHAGAVKKHLAHGDGFAVPNNETYACVFPLPPGR